MSSREARRLVFASLAGALTASCSGGNLASNLVQPPTFEPQGQAKCGVSKSQARPLIVEWPSTDRADLEAQARRGVVVVHYEGCDMEVLRQCRAPGAYGYVGLTRKDDRITIHDADELYEKVPLGAVQLEGKLQKAGALDVSMTIVGKYEAERPAFRKDELDGDCARATHVVTSLTAGAFEFFAGADAAVGGNAGAAGAGVGAASASKRELLNRDGDASACKSSSDDKRPPDGCGALLRLEVVPLAASAPAPAAPASGAPAAGRSAPAAPTASPAAPSASAAPAAPAPSAAPTAPAATSAPTSSPPPSGAGLDKAVVLKVMATTRGPAEACYRRAATRNPSLAGAVKARVTVGPTGIVELVSSEGSSMPDAGVQSCVLSEVRKLVFPATPDGKSFTFTYPYSFGAGH